MVTVDVTVAAELNAQALSDEIAVALGRAVPLRLRHDKRRQVVHATVVGAELTQGEEQAVRDAIAAHDGAVANAAARQRAIDVAEADAQRSARLRTLRAKRRTGSTLTTAERSELLDLLLGV